MSETPGEIVCEAKGLAHRFGPLSAVRDIGFRVRRGEVLALLGPNGAGKTTALSMLTGNLAPHAGSIRIGGHDLLASPRAAKRALGYLPEEPPLYPDMSVDTYLGWCARLHGVKRSRRSRAVAIARERTGLNGEGKRLLGHLSKGYRQRVGIAQAIVHQPALIVLDEPTVGLDPLQSRETRRLIRSLSETSGLIFSTHLLAEASEIASRIAILHRGRIAHETGLEDRAQSAAQFRLELARPPDPERLQGLPGVAAVVPLDDGSFVVTAEPDADPREALARAAVAADWGLLALSPHRPSLEALFLGIVHDESDPNNRREATP